MVSPFLISKTISAVNPRDMLRKSSSAYSLGYRHYVARVRGNPAALFSVPPATSNDANDTNLVLAPPAGDANRVMSNYDKHPKKPRSREQDAETWEKKKKQSYENQEDVARHTLSEKRSGLSRPHPFGARELGIINIGQIEIKPFLQRGRG